LLCTLVHFCGKFVFAFLRPADFFPQREAAGGGLAIQSGDANATEDTAGLCG